MATEEWKRLGYWLSQKKAKKLSVPDIEASLRDRLIEPIKIDLKRPLEEQGPFHGILHKLTDFIASAEAGDEEAASLVSSIENYLKANPSLVVIDSIQCLRSLINRYKTYSIINTATQSLQGTAFIPAFVALEGNDFQRNVEILKGSGITFPAVCKPIVAHGCNAHQMTLIFNEAGLDQISYPCVVQSFVNHNAVLFKLFAIGEKFFVTERPSIKNFYNSEGYPPIHFDGNEVSKANSVSNLTVLEEPELEKRNPVEPCSNVLKLIVKEIGRTMGLSLFGVDVVVDMSSGRHAIVDVNAFPGYDGVENFSEELADHVRQELDKDCNHRDCLPNGE